MPRLTRAQRTSRIALDYRLARAMNGHGIVVVSAHDSLDALKRGSEISSTNGEAGATRVFAAEYRFPFLIGRGASHDRARVTFDVSDNEYPFSPPITQIVSRPFPWSPHVHPGTGLVCIGESWTRARGEMTTAHLIVHVARLLNCDEPPREPWYTGWNAEAVRYWREVLKYQPLNRGLRYPVFPVELTHGISRSLDMGAFVPREDDGFDVVGTLGSDDGAFQAVRT